MRSKISELSPTAYIQSFRKDFPILQSRVNGKPLVYFDNAATTLKPREVVDRINQYYLQESANIHRGVHYLSECATSAYETSRSKVASFINAMDESEIIFTSGTTASINLIAQSYARTFLKENDEIIITYMEHHSNIVPWQMLAEEKGVVLKVVPINDKGEFMMEEYKKLFTSRTKLVSVVYISNSLGTINPVKEIIRIAHENGSLVSIDGAQAVAHTEVDVQDLDADFFSFSAHKIFAGTGCGVLYGKKSILEDMPPVTGGGDMIKSVCFGKTTYADLPARLEAGTPNIAGVISLGAAVDYVKNVGLKNIREYENDLLEYGTKALGEIKGLRLIGTADKKAAILSFVIDGVHAHDVGSILDQEGVAVRAGHHCTQPVMARFKVPATARASLAFYNTKSEIDTLVGAISKVKEIFL